MLGPRRDFQRNCARSQISHSCIPPYCLTTQTSGTLCPMQSFSSELGCQFSQKLEAGHVIDDSQCWVANLSRSPSNYEMKGVYSKIVTPEYQDAVGESLLRLAEIVPQGMLLFVPVCLTDGLTRTCGYQGYHWIDKFRTRWTRTGLWDSLNRVKRVFEGINLVLSFSSYHSSLRRKARHERV